MQKKVESKRKIREMKVSEKLSFPIEVLETVRNNVSLLNAKYLEREENGLPYQTRKKGSFMSDA